MGLGQLVAVFMFAPLGAPRLALFPPGGGPRWWLLRLALLFSRGNAVAPLQHRFAGMWPSALWLVVRPRLIRLLTFVHDLPLGQIDDPRHNAHAQQERA